MIEIAYRTGVCGARLLEKQYLELKNQPVKGGGNDPFSCWQGGQARVQPGRNREDVQTRRPRGVALPPESLPPGFRSIRFSGNSTNKADQRKAKKPEFHQAVFQVTKTASFHQGQ
jgi:hypothetical protein